MSTFKKIALTLLAVALPCFAWAADKWAAWEPLAFSAATTSSTQGGINGSAWRLQNNNGSSTITDGVMSVVASSAAPCVDMTAVNTFGTTNPLTLVATIALTETSGLTMPIITFDGWQETMTFVLCATSVSEADGATLTLQYRDHAKDALSGAYTTHSETVTLPEATPGTDVTLSIFLSSAGVQLFTLADDVATLRKTWDVADDAARFNRVTFGGYHGGNATYAYSMKSLAFYRNTDGITPIFPTVVTIDSAALRFGAAADEAGDPTAARLSERSTRSVKTARPAEGVEVKQYTKELASGGEYTRTLVKYTNNTDLNLPLAGLEVKDATLFAAGATTLEKVGNTDGAVIAARTGDGAQAWFAVEHPFTRYTLPDAASTQLRKTLSFDTAKTTYTVADLSNISKPATNTGDSKAVGMGILYIPITVHAGQTSVTLTLQYKNIGNGNGSWAALFGDVDIYDASGFFVKTHEQAVLSTGSSGTYTTTITDLTAEATYLLAVQSGADYASWSDSGTSDGTITLTNATAVAGNYTLFLDKSASAETYVSLSSRGTTDENSTKATIWRSDFTDYCLEAPILITDPDNVELTIKHVNWHSINIGGLKLYTETGVLVRDIVQKGTAASADSSNNVFTITGLPASYEGEVLIAVFTLWADGTSHGTIICSGAEPTTGFLPKACLISQKTNYALADLQNVNTATTSNYGHGIIDVPILVTAEDFSVTIEYTNGNLRHEIYKVELIDAMTGEIVETVNYLPDGTDFLEAGQNDTACTGDSDVNNTASFTSDACDALNGKHAIARFYVGIGFGANNNTAGQFRATNAAFVSLYAPVIPDYDAITAVVPLEGMSLAAGKSITISYVTGTVDEASQFRRAYNEYLNAERAHPHRMLPHYNSWYDLCINRNDNQVSERFSEDEALASMRAFRTELWERRGVSIDSYLWDDGWDNWNSLWDFNDNFQPQGFTNLADEAHKVPGASIAAWMSPFGGYGGSFEARKTYAKSQGYIPQDATGLDMSAETYYNAFRDRVLQMITDYDMNLFKFDRMGSGGDATGVSSGYNAQLMAVGNLCAEMRAAKPDVFINATVGTWGSPYWLMWADSIWRGGNDCAASGTGTARQQWLTYRDNIIYDRFVNNGCLLPLNSIMMHGIIVCKASPSNTMKDYKGTGSNYYNGVGYATPTACADFASEVWMGMMLGTGLQEYYITPSFMSDDWWDILAKGVKYLKANATILTDSHWIGGDPNSTVSTVYGYASLGDRKGIVTLRNPTNGTLTIKDSLDDWLEMPEALKKRKFTFKTIFNSTAEYENASNASPFSLPAVTTTDIEANWTLPAYATVVFEVNFENTNEVVIDANTYETFSAWKSVWMTEHEIAEDGFASAIFQKDVILDFGNITEAKTFTFDEGLSIAGKLYIAGNQSATGTIALADGVSVAAMGGTLIETQVIVPPALLNSLDDPYQAGVKGGVEIGPSAVVSINVVAGQTGTLTAVPTGSGELIKVGMGTLELAGGIYVQPITVKQGVISVAAASQFIEMVAVNKFMTLQADAETTFSGLVVLNGTLTANAATSFDRNLSVSTSATINGTTAITQNCNVQVSADATLTVETPVVLERTITKSGAGAITYYGKISGNYGLTVNAGTMTLSAANEYATTTVNSNATLVVNGASDTKVLPEGKAVTVNAGGTINLVSGLSFVNISGEGQTVVSGTYDFGISGNLVTGISTKQLHIEETGTLQIRAWKDYTFNIKELIVDGTMQKDPDNNGTKTPSVTVPGTGTLSGTGTLELPLTLADGATIDAREGAVTVTGSVTQSDALTVDVTGLAAGAPILTCATTNLNLEQMTAKGLGAGLLLVKNDTVLSVAKAVTEREVGTYEAIVAAIAEITAAHQDASLILTKDIDLGGTTLVIDAGEGNTVTINLNQRMISASVPVIRIESGTLKLVAVEVGSNTVKSTAATAIVVGADADGNAVAEACALDIGAGVTVSTEASLPAVNVVSGAISGAGTIPGELKLASGATIDVTAGTQVTAMTVSTLPDTLTVKVAALPVEGTPMNVVKLAFAFANDASLIDNLSVVVGEKTYTTGYKFVMTDSGYAVAADPICRIGSTGYPTLEDALATIDKTGDELVETTIALTKDLTLDQTVVVNVGSALQNNKRYGNTLVIDLAGHTITSTANPAFLVECGILKFESSTEASASVSAAGAGPAVVVGTGDSTKAYTGLRVGADVTVTSAIDTSVAVVVGHIGGAGTIKGLNLADETVIDISTGDLLTVTGSLTFPPQVETAGELQNGRVDIYLPEGATFPAPFVNFTGATQAAADKVNTYGKHPDDMNASYNFAPVLTYDNENGAISGYAIMQYTWITGSGELYTTIAEAYADGATVLTQYENTSEYVTVPAGVTVNSLGFTINGNVTVQNGGKYVSYGTINGNLVLEAGSEIDISTNLGNTDETGTWELMVNGDVIFPEGDTIAEGENAGKPNAETVEVTITVGESNSTAALGEPLVLIHSPNGTPGDIADGVTLKIIFAENSSAIDNYHVVRTTEYYMLSTHDTGACNFDGIEYETIADALADYTVKSNQTIKLNKDVAIADVVDGDTIIPAETIVIDVGEGNTVTIDLNGFDLTSTADPAIRIQSGNLALESTTETSVSNAGTTILVGAVEAGTASDTACGLFIGENVTVSTTAATTVNVINGGVSGEGTISGNLTLANGAMVDATHGVLTMAGTSTITFPKEAVVDGDTTTYTNNTIQVMTPAGVAYPAEFIKCAAATADDIANVNVEVIINGEEATNANFSIEVKYADDQTTVTGYAVDGDGYAALAVVGDEMTPHKEFANAVNKAGVSGTVILLADVTIAGELSTNIYTNGHNVTIDEAHTLTGTLTLTHGTIITANDTLTATSVVVEANSTVTLYGYISAPIVNSGTLDGMGEITGTLRLTNGATVAGTCAPSGGTTIDEGATVTVDGYLSGNLTVPNATINGAGAIFILGSDTLAGAGTIHPTVTLTSGATIDKVGYEANHLVLTTLTPPAAEDRFTVKANTLANVMNTKTSPVAAENFVLSMADGSAYAAYVAQESGANLVIPTVAVNGSDYTVGVVKLNLVLAGVRLGADGGARMASYAYRQGILEVKGVYNDIEAYQLFSNVGTGFTSAGYVMVDYKFGVKNITVLPGTKTVNEEVVNTNYIVVTADVDGINDKTEGDLSGNAGYRTGTRVELLDGEDNAVIGAVELTADNDETYGLTYTAQAGVKYFIVELPPGPNASSETLSFKVKATNTNKTPQ